MNLISNIFKQISFALSDIGSIAICGTKKTVVYNYGITPPVKTYPVVASGAIVTDIIDEYGTQYICCFMAKEKRLSVFDLRTKVTVVSKLQELFAF